MKKSNALIIIALAIVIVLIGVVVASNLMHATKNVKNPIVTMEIANYGTVKIELYPDMAPNTVANFIKLINDGYYNGLELDKFGDNMITNIANSDDSNTQAIEGEFLENGHEENTLRHDRGVISMSRYDYSSMGLVTEGYNSAFAEFAIMTENTSGRNGYYAGFGKVTEGMEIIDKILNDKNEEEAEKEAEKAKSESTTESKTEETTTESETEATNNTETTEDTTKTTETTAEKEDLKITISKMTVDTFGVNYGEPKRIEAFDINSYIRKLYGLSF